MKFVCDRCQTKYSIADEKVRGKILKVRCKSCANIITVREEGAAARRPSAPASPLESPAARRPSAPAHPVSHPSPAQRPAPPDTVIDQPFIRPPIPAAARLAPAAPPPIDRRTVPRPPPDPAEDAVAWYMALDGQRTGPFPRKQLLDKIAPLPKDADLHVWNEKLGSWKPPTDVPALAGELAARRRRPTPPPIAAPAAPPPPPPPFPGAPRRPTIPVPPGLAATSASAAVPPPRPSGTHPVVGAPIGPGVGLKLPPPVAPPGGRRPTGPIARPGVSATAAVAPEPSRHESGLDVDPTSLLETPGPEALHGLGTNGVAHVDASAEPLANGAMSDHSDALKVLNLASASGVAAAPAVTSASSSGVGPAPRLLSSEAVVGWEPSAAAQAPGARHRTTMIVALIGVVALVCVVLMFGVLKKPKSAAPLAPAKSSAIDPLAAAADTPPSALPGATAPGPSTAPAPAAAPEPAGHGHGKAHGAHGRNAAPTATAPAAVAAAPAAPASDANARYRDDSHLNISAGPSAARPPPSQGDISRVVHNNMGGIRNCYQRALLRDNSLTHGKISVKVNIGISGRVKHTAVDGPPMFRAIEPCIKEVVGRWAFPPAGDEYGTEFVYVFQGNE